MKTQESGWEVHERVGLQLPQKNFHQFGKCSSISYTNQGGERVGVGEGGMENVCLMCKVVQTQFVSSYLIINFTTKRGHFQVKATECVESSF